MPPKYTTKVESVTLIKEGAKVVGFIARGESCAGASLIYTAELANTETVARFIEPAPAIIDPILDTARSIGTQD